MDDKSEYLVSDGVKKCRQCNERKFTVDFANSDLFADKNLPVCIACYRTVAGQAYVNELNIEKKCKKCEGMLNLAEFSVVGVHAHTSLPHMNDSCRECSSASFLRFGNESSG